jgi:hypothetical protein
MNNLFKQKSVSKSTIILFTAVGVVLIGIFCLLQIIDYSMIHSVTMDNIVNNEDFEWRIDSIRIDTRYIAVSGWAYLHSEGYRSFNINVVLENTSTKEAIVIPTTLMRVESMGDVDGQNYAEGGFFAKVNKNLIHFPENDYKIFLEFQGPEDHFFFDTLLPLENTTGD